MGLDNIRMEITTEDKLNTKEYNIILQKYYELFLHIYGKNLADSFAKGLNNSNKLGKFILQFSDSYNLAMRALSQTKSNTNEEEISLLKVYLNDELASAARLRKVNSLMATIPDVIFLTNEKIKLELWKKILEYVENLYQNNKIVDMYVEVPINDFTLLSGCFDRGFTECDGASKTHLLGKKLERINK